MCEKTKKKQRFKQVEVEHASFAQVSETAAGDNKDKASQKGGDKSDKTLCGVKCLTKPKVV